MAVGGTGVAVGGIGVGVGGTGVGVAVLVGVGIGVGVGVGVSVGVEVGLGASAVKVASTSLAVWVWIAGMSAVEAAPPHAPKRTLNMMRTVVFFISLAPSSHHHSLSLCTELYSRSAHLIS